jgi:glycosyltransferase involved in cell wall biosynthesis
MKTISIVAPCFNEVDNVERCYDAVRALFTGPLSAYRLELIFADNASTDGTVDILRTLAARDEHVKVVLNSRNFGFFRSIFNALRHASGDAVVVFLPVDLQDPPEMIVEFVKHWENGIEIVAGRRATREEGFLIRTARRIFYRLVNRLSDFEIPVDVGEFQLIDRKVWQAVVRHDDQYPYIRGIIASVGFKRLVIPYTWKAREHGKSKHNLLRLTDQALNGIFSFTNVPMRLCSFIGFGLSVLCILYALFAVIAYFAFPGAAPRGITTLLVSLFFLSGMQLAFIGMLGEYVTAIQAQVRRGPMVVERELINIER